MSRRAVYPLSPVPHFGDFQLEMYLAGVGGETPRYPVTFRGLQEAAREVMSPRAFDYVAGSAGSELTARANRAAFRRWQIVPRLLRNVAERDLSTEVCGTTLPAPILMAPIGAIGIVHPEAELAVARAAARVGVPLILSTVASTPMEAVAATLAAGDASGGLGPGTGWYQLYWPKDRDVAVSLVTRAERAGFRAVVVTLDTWALAWRPRDLGHGYLPMMHGIGLANYVSDPAFLAGLSRPPEEDMGAAILHWAAMFGNPALTWADIEWLRSQTRLPILVKGVCHPDDARLAIDAGVAGIVVSNHGGRQIDGARPALDCLPEICAVAGDTPVLFDSGIRTGSDIVKAIALGARAVLVGRPYVYGLALGGEEGVRHVLRCLLAELDLTLALSGHATLHTLDRDGLVAQK
jgi:lactate 2-monooxygenase